MCATAYNRAIARVVVYECMRLCNEFSPHVHEHMYRSELHRFSPVTSHLYTIGTHACVHAIFGNCAHIAMQPCTHSNDHISALIGLCMFGHIHN